MGEEFEVKTYDVFGPVAFALKGMELPADLASRSIRVNMQRAPRQMEKFTPTLERTLEQYRVEFEDWADRATCEANGLKMPTGLINRGADNWRPLLAVAHAVGGDWHERIMEAATAYQVNHQDTDRNMMLLEHLKAIWPEGEEFAWSEKLVSALNDNEEWPWGEYGKDGLTPHALAKKLKHFEITPQQRRLSSRVSGSTASTKARGYRRTDFEKVWTAYGV
jgi:Protein of unknown function (DUF3631)